MNTKLYNKVVLKINEDIRQASEATKKRILDFDVLKREAEAVIKESVINPLDAVLKGMATDDVRTLIRLGEEAYADSELYEDAILKLREKAREEERPLIGLRTHIHDAISTIPNIKRNLMVAKASGEDYRHFAKSFKANIDGLIRLLDDAGIELELIKAIRDDLLEVPETDLHELFGVQQ